jgi:hypothetical protein
MRREPGRRWEICIARRPARFASPRRCRGDAALRAVVDSALAEAMGGGAEVYRVDADIRELSRYVGVGFAAGAVAGLLVGAIVEDKNGLYAAPLLILYTAGGAAVGMATGAVVYYARGGRT